MSEGNEVSSTVKAGEANHNVDANPESLQELTDLVSQLGGD